MKTRAQHSRRRRRRPERAHAAARRICNTVSIVYIVGEGWRNLPRVVALLLGGVIASHTNIITCCIRICILYYISGRGKE